MKRFHAFLALAAFAFAPTLAKADPISYTFSQTYTQNSVDSFTITGTLTTDGTLGALAETDITGYDIIVTQMHDGTASAEFTSTNGTTLTYPGGLTATAGSLLFTFGNSGYDLHLQASGGNGNLLFSNNSVYFDGLGNGTTEVSESGTQMIASVASASAPEPSSLALLGTGIAAMAGITRRRFSC